MKILIFRLFSLLVTSSIFSFKSVCPNIYVHAVLTLVLRKSYWIA